MTNRSVDDLKALARSIRKDVLTMTFEAGVNGGHIGGGFHPQIF